MATWRRPNTKREALLAFIRAEHAAGRGMPTPAAMQRACGYRASTAMRDQLHALVSLGDLRVVERTPTRNNGWRYRYELVERRVA